jgi:hypothetical protein
MILPLLESLRAHTPVHGVRMCDSTAMTVVVYAVNECRVNDVFINMAAMTPVRQSL